MIMKRTLDVVLSGVGLIVSAPLWAIVPLAIKVDSPAGPVAVLLPPPECDDWDWRLDGVPALGEHSEPILHELGYGAAERERFRAEGVVGTPDTP